MHRWRHRMITWTTTFFAPAGIPYRFWMRIRALGNTKFNDAVWVQFSEAQGERLADLPAEFDVSGLLVNLATDAGAASLNSWGWANGAYWLSQPATFMFSSTGTHTMRIQIREDGVQLDQIVLSPTTYLNDAAGPANQRPDDRAEAMTKGAVPYISVSLATRNRAALLAETLDALAAQRWPRDRFEIVVADNGSTDDTRSVVERAARAGQPRILLPALLPTPGSRTP